MEIDDVAVTKMVGGVKYSCLTAQSWFNLYIPLSVGHPGIIRKYCELLVSNEIVQTILECIKVGAVTTCSGNAFHGEITLVEKKFLLISFLHEFFFV